MEICDEPTKYRCLFFRHVGTVPYDYDIDILCAIR